MKEITVLLTQQHLDADRDLRINAIDPPTGYMRPVTKNCAYVNAVTDAIGDPALSAYITGDGAGTVYRTANVAAFRTSFIGLPEDERVYEFILPSAEQAALSSLDERDPDDDCPVEPHSFTLTLRDA